MAEQDTRFQALDAAVTDTLFQLFEAHHVMPVMEEGEIHFCGYPCRVSARVRPQPRRGAGHTVLFTVRMILGPGEVLFESMAGVGESLDGAIRDALEAFSANVLHVLLAAFLDQPNERAALETWQVNGHERQVTLGDLVTRGRPPVAGEALVAWMPQFKALLQGSRLPAGTHWVRFYHAQLPGAPDTWELLLDNEPWEELLPAVTALPLPRGTEFYSFRLFLVLDGGTDLAQILSTMLRLKEKDDAAISEDLVRQGMPQPEAFKATMLVPLAVARVLLASLGIQFGETATVIPVETGKAVERSLQEEPFYRDAYRLAEAARVNGSMTKEEVTTLSLRSAEFQAVNQALHAGSQPGNLVLSPPVIQGWPEVPAGAASSSASASQGLQAAVGAKKPWWKIWG